MAQDKSQAIQIEDLAGFRRALKAMDAALPKELRTAAKEIAEPIAADTRSSFASRAGVAPKVASSVKVLASGNNVFVRIGGAGYPYALGSEFGSVQYTQFPAWTGSNSGSGYSLYPSIRAHREDVADRYLDAMEALAAKAFPN